MRRLWVKLLLASVVVALAFVWWWISRPGAPSRLTAFLPAKGVNAAVFIDDPADLILSLEKRFAVDGAETFSSEDVIKALKFDPSDGDTWAHIGIAEDAGVAVVLYEATGNAPIILAQIDDEVLFEKWLMDVVSDGETGGRRGDRDLRMVTLANTQLLVGRRGPYSAIMRGGESRIGAFQAFLAAEGRLITNGPLRAMFLTAATKPRMVAFAQTEKLAQLAGEAPVTQFLTVRAPLVSGYFDDVQGVVAISLTESGRQDLKALTRVHGAPPAFSRLMPARDWSALRVSLDLGQAFEDLPLLKYGLRIKYPQWGGWAYVDGVERTYARIGSRLSGHFVVAVSNASLAEVLANPGQAELDWAVLAGIAPNEARPALNGLEAPARYVNGIAVFASSPKVLDLIKPAADGEPASTHKLLDDELLLGLTLTAKELLDTLESAVPPSVFELFKTSNLAQQAQLSIGFALKPEGIVSRGDTSALIATAGLVALVVYPDLARRRRARWQREARIFVGRIAEGAIAAWERRVPNDTDGRAAPRSFPADEPLTPPHAKADCEPFEADASQWDTPGWQALNFAVYDTHRYQYSFESGPNGFTARAIGNLDCDDVTSTFEAIGRIVGPADAGEVILTTTEIRAQE